MDTSIVVSIVAAIAAFGAAVLTYRSTAQANASNQRKVDLEEHRDAIERLRKIIEEQDRHVERVRVQLDRVQDQLAREQDVSNALRSTVRHLQEQVDELTRSRRQLEEMLSVHMPHLLSTGSPKGQERKP